MKAIGKLADAFVKAAPETRQAMKAIATPATVQVDEFLRRVEAAHAACRVSPERLAEFQGEVDGWLTPAHAPTMDVLFDRVAVERVPGAFCLLLLACTRLARHHFQRREAFFERLRTALLVRGDRTADQIDRMLRGLRA